MDEIYSVPDTVWLNGCIRTMDEAKPYATAMAACGQMLTYIGNDSEARDLIGEKTRVVNLEGGYVLPGFIEGHMHLAMYGESLMRLNIRNLSKKEILAAVKEAAESLPAGQWIVGGMGWNNELWEDPGYPTCEELDLAAPHHPVLLPRMDGHLIWVNSLAFLKAGITDETPNPLGGEFMRTPEGRLQGCAGNAAAQIVRAFIPSADSKTRAEAFLLAQKQLFSYGITSINDMMTQPDDFKLLQELYKSGVLKLRFSGALNLNSDSLNLEEEALFQKCPLIDLYDHRFTLRAVKILGDGSVGAQSCALFEPFSDRPEHCGILMKTDDEMYRVVSLAAQKGMQVMVHAIGDRAIDQILRVYEKVLERYPNPDHRFHIEHFQLVTGDSLERAKRLGVVAGMQPLHGPNSAAMGLRRLGKERAGRAYAMGMVLNGLGMVSAGSDAPVASPSPISGIHAAVTRTNDAGEPEGGFCMENAITSEEALKAYTVWGAYAQFTEKTRGSLSVGKLADFVVLSDDVCRVDPCDLLSVRVLQTVIGSEKVYDANEKE